MKLLFFTAILAISTQTVAQTTLNKQVVCENPAAVFQAITEEYQERPFWAAKSENNDSRYILLVNQKTKTWTFIQFNEKLACVLGSGDNSITVEEFKSIKK